MTTDLVKRIREGNDRYGPAPVEAPGRMQGLLLAEQSALLVLELLTGDHPVTLQLGQALQA
jgi:hypothetical protein